VGEVFPIHFNQLHIIHRNNPGGPAGAIYKTQFPENLTGETFADGSYIVSC
jgi:hypothetical protein